MTFFKKYFWTILPPILSVIIYINALPGPFIWDDTSIILQAPEIKSFSDIIQRFRFNYWAQLEQATGKPYRKGVYRPLRNLSFCMEKKLWGNNAFGYRLTNVIIHACNSGLVSFLGKSLFASNAAGLFAGLLFASHPAMIESVSYIKNRGNLLSACLCMLYLLAWLNRKFLLFHFLYILSLFTMESTIVFPLIIFSFIFMLSQKEQWVDNMMTLKFQLIVMLSYAAIIYFVLKPYQGLNSIETKMIVSHLSFAVRFFSSLLAYIKLYLWPTGLCIDRPLEIFNAFFSMDSFIGYTCLVMVVWFIFIHNDYPKMFFSCAIMLITLLPVLNIIPLDSRPFAEQRLYLPMIGGSLFFAGFYCIFESQINKIKAFPIQISLKCLTCVLLICMIGVLTVSSVTRNSLYRNPSLLWLDARTKYPDIARIHYKLAAAFYYNHEYIKSLKSLKKCLEIDPEFQGGYLRMGITYMKLDDQEMALGFLLKALKQNPNDYYTVVLLAKLYLERGNHDKACEYFSKASEISPQDDYVLSETGHIHLLNKAYDKAMTYFLRSVEINPENCNALNDMGYIYTCQKNYDKAIKTFQKVIEIDPEFSVAHYNLAYAYQMVKQYDQAIVHYQETIHLAYLYYDAHSNLAYVFHQAGDHKKAINVYKNLLKIKSGDHSALKGLGDIYYELKD